MDRDTLEKVGKIMQTIADGMGLCRVVARDGGSCDNHAVYFGRDDLFTAKLFLEKLAAE